jgi:hypothetical protein
VSSFHAQGRAIEPVLSPLQRSIGLHDFGSIF